MESSVLHFVNPYDVNPISGTGLAAPEESITAGVNIKLEMEEFSDLAPFLPGTIQGAISNSVDELNTPVFDRKGPFNFTIHENTLIEAPSAADPYKFEYDPTGNCVNSNKKLNDFSVCLNNMNVQVQESDNSEVVNIIQGSEALLFTTSESDQKNIYIINNGNETPIHVQSEDHLSASIYKIEDTNSVVSVKSIENQYSNVSSPSDEYFVNTKMSTEAHYSNMSSPNNEYCRKNLGIETPEDSNSSSWSNKTTPKLKLTKSFDHSLGLNTPDVIDSVVDLEGSFNIIDYINAKEITTINIEDIELEQPSTSKDSESLPQSSQRKRKSKRYDDDDEDYVPPVKTILKQESSDSESENESPKKGRSKRRSSFSSDHSDASKYRELRDKNNEASRKSRLKRKMKEMSLQQECDELYEKNVKLKAQVAEYEKMVNNFRNNLFKIMLKK